MSCVTVFTGGGSLTVLPLESKGRQGKDLPAVHAHSGEYYSFIHYKKVLLRERKRHTARRVASARYAALSPNLGGGGYPIQSWTGEPCKLGYPHLSWPETWPGWGVYPISGPGWGSTPSQIRMGGGAPSSPGWGRGYPHPDLGPDLDGGCTPSQVQDGGTPSQVRMGGTPSSPGWRGVLHPVLDPGVPPPNPDLGPDPDRGYPRYYLPAVRTCNGVPPHPGLGWVPPPHPDLGWDTPALSWTWEGVAPSPPVEMWTDRQTENITFPPSFGCGR